MKLNIQSFIIKNKWKLLFLLLLLIAFFIIPSPCFDDIPTSTVIQSSEGELLGARISADEQWRFALIDSVPPKFETCIIQFEDKWFRYHPGINPISILKALFIDIKAGKVVCGGSTLTMQTIRLARKGKSRTIKEKFIEMFFAVKYELKFSKNKILRLYASYAPFGGNVVGLEAASWRYFGRSPDNLTWAESATLAVLPNAPALIYPGKNQQILKNKRDKLLSQLCDNGTIDSLTYQLSIKEKLPQKPNMLPLLAPHLLDRIEKKHRGERIRTTLSYGKQKEAARIVNLHSKQLANNEIFNAAAIIVNNETGNIIAYVGNTNNGPQNASSVDIIVSPRSTGSVIKPMLYAAMLDNGEMLPQTIVPDIPVFYEGFTPENYNRQYDGAVPADEALSRSLNVPAVHMLAAFGVDRFISFLRKIGFTTITHSADYYGLSLILGGAEIKLWDLVKVYSGLACTLNNVPENGYKYSESYFKDLNYLQSTGNEKNKFSEEPLVLSAASIWSTFEALQKVVRPDNQVGWEAFSSAHQIAWKTGTSYGFRDAWAVGVSPQYTIGVWVGNADGEGRPGITGVTAAAPIMFDLFDLMNPEGWFPKPYDEFIEVPVCHHSGFLASIHCPDVDTVEVPAAGLRTKVCPYHKNILTNKSGTYRVTMDCEEPDNVVPKSWFILPPVMAYYYAKRHPDYKQLPPYSPNCNQESKSVMSFIYPRNVSKIFIPVNYEGKRENVIFEVAHSQRNMKLFWHLDNEYLGETSSPHQVALCPAKGKHKVTVVDELGNSISYRFEVMQ